MLCYPHLDPWAWGLVDWLGAFQAWMQDWGGTEATLPWSGPVWPWKTLEAHPVQRFSSHIQCKRHIRNFLRTQRMWAKRKQTNHMLLFRALQTPQPVSRLQMNWGPAVDGGALQTLTHSVDKTGTRWAKAAVLANVLVPYMPEFANSILNTKYYTCHQ